nr:polyphenol oxidase E, chloroplastic-like [Ipomoea batatas]
MGTRVRAVGHDLGRNVHERRCLRWGTTFAEMGTMVRRMGTMACYAYALAHEVPTMGTVLAELAHEVPTMGTGLAELVHEWPTMGTALAELAPKKVAAMASISCIITTNLSSSPHPFPIKHPKISLINSNAPKRHNTISCASSSSDEDYHKNPLPSSENISDRKLDRRNVLLGLGGLYGAYAFDPFALAAPVPAPDVTKCSRATISFSVDNVPYSCCPPLYGTISDYEVPSFTRLNVRPAAHKVSKSYIRKYEAAIKKMKELPCDDPRNFYQQANVHCAYCNGAYQLAGQPYDVHSSWLFFPFHRWYLYFFERILQSLIDDPTFALPYWNWDNPPGMYFPDIFDDKSSPLYDEFRNADHRGGYLMDLAYAGQDLAAEPKQIVNNNLAIMYRQMVTNAPCPLLFFGAPLRADGYGPGGFANGTIVSVPHNSVHRWVGDPRTSHNEDMGNFYSAAKDPVFYCHHSNVDRMWTIWKTLGGKRMDIADPDYLNSEFLFYDENKNLVKVKIGDCLDNEKLGYTFQDMPTPWKSFKLTRKRTKLLIKSAKATPSTETVLPATLTKILTFSVARPVRTEADKEDMEELLNLGLEYDDTKYIRFDVFLNEDEDVILFELDRAEFVSSFANLPHVHEGHGEGEGDAPTTTTWRLPITEVLENLGIEGEDTVVVTLVPKCEGEFMNITKAEIELVNCVD